MNIITPATSMSPDTQEYLAKGKVLRVFDTNGFGDLRPVDFVPHADSNKFTMSHPPFGKVYAEVVSEI